MWGGGASGLEALPARAPGSSSSSDGDRFDRLSQESGAVTGVLPERHHTVPLEANRDIMRL